MGVTFKKALKWSISFFLDGSAPVRYLRCRVRWAGKTVGLNLGRKIEVAKWDAKKQLCKPNTTHQGVSAHVVNVDIFRLRDSIERIFATSALNGVAPSVDEIKKALHNESDGGHSIATLVDECAAEKSKTVRKSTTYNYRCVKNQLKKIDDVPTLETMGQKFATEWLAALSPLASTTQRSYSTFLIVVLRWACKKYQLTPPIPLDCLKPRRQKQPKQVVYLELDEIEKIENVNLPPRLDEMRRAFLFSCFTGLRHSDILQCSYEMIKGNNLTITTQKTNTTITIPLSTNALRIMGENKKTGKMFIVPVSHPSDRVKEIAKLAGLDTPVHIAMIKGNERINKTLPKWDAIGYHTARRTFICQSLIAGVPPNVLIKWTGHNNITAMQPYIDATGVAVSLFADKLNFGQK